MINHWNKLLREEVDSPSDLILSKIRLYIFLENKYFTQPHVTELKTEAAAGNLKSLKIYVIRRVIIMISLP